MRLACNQKWSALLFLFFLPVCVVEIDVGMKKVTFRVNFLSCLPPPPPLPFSLYVARACANREKKFSHAALGRMSSSRRSVLRKPPILSRKKIIKKRRIREEGLINFQSGRGLEVVLVWNEEREQTDRKGSRRSIFAGPINCCGDVRRASELLPPSTSIAVHGGRHWRQTRRIPPPPPIPPFPDWRRCRG